MLPDLVQPFLASAFQLRRAQARWELDGARRLRRQVFCIEQGIFEHSDVDDIDTQAIPLIAASLVGGMSDEIVGTVRIHESAPGIWFGSRLAVAGAYRGHGLLGAGLIRIAVGTAQRLGCQRFFAHVQSQNAVFFQRLHWRTRVEVALHGKPHHFMEADLAFYPAVPEHRTDLVTAARSAA